MDRKALYSEHYWFQLSCECFVCIVCICVFEEFLGFGIISKSKDEAVGEQRDGAVRVGAAEELRDHRDLPQQIPPHLQEYPYLHLEQEHFEESIKKMAERSSPFMQASSSRSRSRRSCGRNCSSPRTSSRRRSPTTARAMPSTAGAASG